MTLQVGSMYYYMNNIETLLVHDEELVRLLAYNPMGFDSVTKQVILDPLDESLPNLVDDTEESWALRRDRIRKGEKRIDIENDAKCFLYIQEGRRRPYFGNSLLLKQEVRFSILIHESFEPDWRISRISERINKLLSNVSGVAGYGQISLVSSDPRDAPKEYRLQEDNYLFVTLNGACC